MVQRTQDQVACSVAISDQYVKTGDKQQQIQAFSTEALTYHNGAGFEVEPLSGRTAACNATATQVRPSSSAVDTQTILLAGRGTKIIRLNWPRHQKRADRDIPWETDGPRRVRD
ncbi:hypothetical protein Y032_0130g1566 [Ancylostoma ceylanicum]|uniref:Uncharacterized protein n=1 Tax=Ancylostoma ceylanicum TaxID=53326 RepID=A0A016T7K7_9BILA|nr:hypothetical protein Y032_0130g1566 [Ancylostoma ceylanicum]